MLVFAAIVPHSPLLIPSIGKEHRDKLAATLDAYAEVERQLHAAKPETLLLFSPHAPMYPDAFSANLAGEYVGGLKEFGDHGTTVTAKADFLLLDHIHRALREEHVPFTLTSQNDLDYGFTVPLILLTARLQSWRAVPLASSMLDARMHYEYGRQLKNILHNETRRIAVIASADLSHHAAPSPSASPSGRGSAAPEGMTEEGKQFDALIRDKIKTMDAPGLLAADPVVIEKAGQCGYKPIVTLLGVLEHVKCAPQELSYEAPFGVGYLTEIFPLA